ncbi:hypothetical protein ETB97_011468 [Aspergillus alliaceus]|uniref:Uncharacterized protein n=1 Tax=Petromyces alliaceus TaxID=209559 RepID=A0A8H6EC82_PETAA|nr:hypothetical protein ETB97_011468 [Aspergillus burnettii]
MYSLVYAVSVQRLRSYQHRHSRILTGSGPYAVQAFGYHQPALGCNGELIKEGYSEVLLLCFRDFSGSFGFGAYQGHAAYFRNVHIYDTLNSSFLYMSPLASEDILAEYGTQAKESICFDGSKRDILVWLGDFVHTARILSVITPRANHAQGTLQFLLDSQIAGGELSISPSIGYNMKLTPDAPAPSDSYYLRDYKLLGSISFHDYMQWSCDLS